MSLFLGAVADDDTGATDLGNMLTLEGMRVAVVTAGEERSVMAAASDCDAIVIGTASRSIAKQDCYERTRAAVRSLRSAGAQRVLIKYCSTFDSTAEGNIGTMIDAGMDEMDCPLTLALPAQPSLGRTTYMGYHFVHEQLLSDSPMRHHPLTPMTNPHLPSHLRTQTARSIGLLPSSVVEAGAERIVGELRGMEAAGTRIALCDCLNARQLHSLGEAAAGMALLTGSSAWGTALPGVWKRSGAWEPQPASPLLREAGGEGILGVSGSCSVASLRQIAWARANRWRVFDLDAAQLARGDAGIAAEDVANAMRSEKRVLVTTQQDLRDASGEPDRDALAFGNAIAHTLARFVQEVFTRQEPAGLIVAGGETSSAVVRAVHLGGMRVGETVERGVPLCVALRMPSLALVLKSGNLGSEDFFARAAKAIDAMPLKQQGEP